MTAFRSLLRNSNNLIADLTAAGYVWNLSEVALGTSVTGPTSFATTTPSFIVNNAAASGVTVVPLYFSYQQAGVVAGGAVQLYMEVDNAARYSSGGTAATAQNAYVNSPGAPALASGVTVFSGSGGGITATNAAGVGIWRPLVGQDISPAEGVTNELVWTPPAGAPELLRASDALGASWLVHAFAASTGPTFFWSAKIAVIPNTEL